MYRCSSCSRPVGAFFDSKGRPELFKCPHSGQISHCVPDRPIVRKPIKINRSLLPEDISIKARKRKLLTVEDL